jgi:hypothetical protein
MTVASKADGGSGTLGRRGGRRATRGMAKGTKTTVSPVMKALRAGEVDSSPAVCSAYPPKSSTPSATPRVHAWRSRKAPRASNTAVAAPAKNRRVRKVKVSAETSASFTVTKVAPQMAVMKSKAASGPRRARAGGTLTE